MCRGRLCSFSVYLVVLLLKFVQFYCEEIPTQKKSGGFVGISFSSSVRQTQRRPEASESPHPLAKALFRIEFPFSPLVIRFLLGNRLKASSHVNSLPKKCLFAQNTMLPRNLQKLAGFSRQCATRTSFTTHATQKKRHTFSDVQRRFRPATSSDVTAQEASCGGGTKLLVVVMNDRVVLWIVMTIVIKTLVMWPNNNQSSTYGLSVLFCIFQRGLWVSQIDFFLRHTPSGVVSEASPAFH